ncbi:MAG TPA: hypothetical protein VII34_11495 [Pyrinomonadaceae bacterium]
MKQQKGRQTAFNSGYRAVACAVLFLFAFALCVPHALASDGCAFLWLGGSGDVNDPKPICFST